MQSLEQETADATAIASEQFAWLVKGNFYFKKQDDIFYKFEAMEQDAALFSYVDYKETQHNLKVPHGELKHFRPTDKTPATKLDIGVVTAMSLEQSNHWELELEKAQAQAAILSLSLQESVINLDHILCFSNQKLITSKEIKKHGIKLFPWGPIQKVKATEEDKDKDKVTKAFKACAIVAQSKNIYQINSPKVDMKKLTGSISFFHWVHPVEEESEATLSLTDTKHGGWLTVPCFTNKKAIPEGVQLTFFKPPVADGGPQPKAKKRKT